MSDFANIDGAAAMAARCERALFGAAAAALASAPSPEVYVMRSASWTRWATCALALSIGVSASLSVAVADGRKKSIAHCTAFEQADKGDDKIEFSIRNTCTIPVDCSISWRVVCAPASKKRRATHPGRTSLALSNGAKQTAEASAAVCGDDAWSIDQISWSCQPNQE